MTYNAKNERIKREYFALLRQADRMAEATIDGIRKAILRYEEFTRYGDFSTFDRNAAVAFKAHMLKLTGARSGRPLSRATVHVTVQAIQAFLRWLSGQPGYKSKIATGDIRYLNLPRKDVAIATAARTKRVPTLEQVRAAIDAMPVNGEIEMRDRALMAFTIVTGIRDSAICSLRLKHIDIHQRLVIQHPAEVDTKFSRRIETFFFPVGDDLHRIVIDWVHYLREIKLFGNDDPLFPRTRVVAGDRMSFTSAGLEPVAWAKAGQIRSIFKAAFERAGVTYFNPHSFRDTLAILGERMCRTPEEFKSWSQNLGHESPLTTFISYGRVSLHRQGELVLNATRKADQDEKIDRLVELFTRLQQRSAEVP